MTQFDVKICGLTEPARLDEAIELGADLVGFVFYPPSARSLRPDIAASLSARVPERIQQVGVFVDPTDEELATVLAEVPLDVVQLHGAETPDRTAEIAVRTGCRVMKAIRVETESDVSAACLFENVADMLLFDAKLPVETAGVPGGNGLQFDWRLLERRRWAKPWGLAGGLGTANLRSAIELLAPPLVDISSGVEVRPGIKNPEKLKDFLELAARLRGVRQSQRPQHDPSQ
jgi:phosphoribosylanthranilate isomerase